MSGSSAESETVTDPRGSSLAILALAAVLVMAPAAFGQEMPGEPLRLIPLEPVHSSGTAPLPPAVEIVPLADPTLSDGSDPWARSDRNRSAALVERLAGLSATDGMRALAEAALARPAFRVDARQWDRLDRARIRALALYGIDGPLIRIVQDGRMPPDERADSLLLADALFALDRVDQACTLVRERSRRWLDSDWIARLALCRFLAERRDEAIEALRALDALGGGDPLLRAALDGLQARRAPPDARAIASRDPATGPLRAALQALGVVENGSGRPAGPAVIGNAAIARLDQAAKEGRAGDVAAMALAAFEDAEPAAMPGPALQRILDGLAAAGWRLEAEAIGREAVQATPPT